MEYVAILMLAYQLIRLVSKKRVRLRFEIELK